MASALKVSLEQEERHLSAVIAGASGGELAAAGSAASSGRGAGGGLGGGGSSEADGLRDGVGEEGAANRVTRKRAAADAG